MTLERTRTCTALLRRAPLTYTYMRTSRLRTSRLRVARAVLSLLCEGVRTAPVGLDTLGGMMGR